MNSIIKKFACTLLLGVGCVGGMLNATAQESIPVGMTTALSGPAKFLGQSMERGIKAYFAGLNASGGVNGRRIELVVLDDSYHPDTAERNMRELIDSHHVLAVIGNVGTPTAKRIVPLANRHRVLLFGAFSGAQLLRNAPPDRYVINFRASYEQEMKASVDAILAAGIPPNQIAFFTQDDSFGDACYQGAVKALKQQGYQDTDLLPHVRYKRNTLNVERALAELLDGPLKPRAILVVGTYKPSAKFIRLARQALPGTLFFNTSFVSATALYEEVGEIGHDIYVTQVVPPFSSELPVARDYRAAMAKHYPDASLDFVSFEGYLAARVFVEGLRRAGPGPVSRESLIDGLESLKDIDIGMGEPVSYSPVRHQASDKVWLTRLLGQGIVAVQKIGGPDGASHGVQIAGSR